MERFSELVQSISATVNQEDETAVDIALITNAIVEMQDIFSTTLAERDNAVNENSLQKQVIINLQEANHKLIMEKTATVKTEDEDVEDVVDEKEQAKETLEELAEEW